MDEEAELSQLREKRLAAKSKEDQSRAAEKQLKEALRSTLSDSAYTRISNVALANKELYLAAAQQVLYAYKRLKRVITEEELLTVLRALKGAMEKEGSIKFERK